MESSRPLEDVLTKIDPVLMKSKHRVQKHGEVFTPQWVIDKMLTIPGVKEKAEDVFATFLEPSAGEGAFLLAIEDLKLRYVTDNYNRDEWNCYGLWALASIYGIEYLEDNLKIARRNLLELFLRYYEMAHNARLSERSNLYKSARTIIWANVVQGDTLTRKNLNGERITLSRWVQVPGAPRMVRRVPFPYSTLFNDANGSGGTQLTLFNESEQLDLFITPDDYKRNNQVPRAYAVVDIEQVWKEEIASVREV